MIHDRAYTRAKTWSKAKRKYHIDRDRAAGRWSPWYDNLHQYADNAIHCGCPMCRAKTNNKNRRGGRGYAPSDNWSISDKRKIDEMKGQLEDDSSN